MTEAMGGTTELDAPHVHHEAEAGTDSAAIVYFTSDISPKGLVAICDALGVELTGEKIAVKITTGEPPNSNYLDPALIGDLVQLLNGTIVESSTNNPLKSAPSTA